MAVYNKGKFYASLNNADVNKDYTHEELLELQKSPNNKASFVEPVKEQANIIGEFVENEGKLLLDSDLPKKKGRNKKTEDSNS